MPKPAAQSHASPDTLGFERLLFFSDAVFAIAITLLALDIRLPDLPKTVTDAGLFAALLGLWQKYLAFAISFLVIASFWLSHRRKFRYIRTYDRALLFLNTFLLMFIVFIPFPTSVLSEFSNRTATIFYAGVMTVTGLLSNAIGQYALRNRQLVDPRITPAVRRRELWGTLVMPLIFLISIGLAFINGDLAKYFWLANLLGIFLYR